MTLPRNWRPGGQGRVFESGQAWVHEVEQPGDERVYALKRLKNLRRRDRFAREVRTMIQLRQGGVAGLPDVVEHDLEDERPYFVMPWYRDGALEAKVEGRAFVVDPLGGLDILKKVALTLQVLHEAGLAHRDVKPANVLLDGPDVVLTDFGLCLQAEDDAERLTALGEAVGSRLYIAPENESGMNESVDQRPTDFYAFGKMIWAVLAGRQPLAREGQLEAAHRLEAVLGEEHFRVLDQLQAQLLDTDPRTRLSEWSSVVRELELAEKRFRGETSEHQPTAAERVLEAGRRLRHLPGLRELRAERSSSEQDRRWVETTLLRAISEVAQEIERAVLAPLSEETADALTIYVASDAEALPSLFTENPTLKDRVPPGFDPDAPSGFGGTGSPVTYTAYSQENLPGLPPVYLALYTSVQQGGIWFLAVPLLRRSPSPGPAVVPAGAVATTFIADGPYPIRLEQTVEAARRFSERAGKAFVEVMERYLAAVNADADPLDPGVWIPTPTFMGTPWRAVARLLPPRSHLGAAAVGARILAVGGQGPDGALARTDLLNLKANTWTPGPPLSSPRMLPMVACLADGSIHAIGGEANHLFSGLNERYDVEGGRWEACAPLPEPRSDGGVVAVPEGVLFVVGGHGHGDVTGRADAYSPREDAWHERAPMPTSRRGFGLAVGSDGRLYAVGGRWSAASGVICATTEIYDPVTDTWSKGPDMPTSRAWCCAAAGTDGRIWVIGGIRVRPDGYTEPVPTVEVFDPETGEWCTGPSLVRPRSSFAAATAGDGTLCVIGGEAAQHGALASVVVLSPDQQRPVS